MLPVITLVQATMTQQAAIMQEASRNQLAANDKNLQFMRESQSANAGIMGQVGQAFNMVVDGARKAMDMANEARGGGGGTAEMVADGLKFFGAEGAEIVKRWTNNAEKREAIKAQKEVTLKQLELQAQLARQGVTGPAQQQQQAQPAAGAGLNGAAQPAPTGPVADAPPATVTKLASVPSPQDVSDEKHFKHALVLKAVRDLRAAVAARKIKDPSVVAQMVIIAVGKVGQAGLEVPAFELLKRGEFDELFELLLPSTAPSFRDECAAILAQMITAPAGIASAKAPEPEEADDDDDEAEEEEDDDADEEEEDESEQAPA